jgi:FKBP-type peptidyl-prolyl cis-trans isomerase (trigger factor)
VKILKQEKKGNQVILEVEEGFSTLSPHMKKAYAEVSMEVRIPGFRPGKIPEDVLKKYISEEAVIDRAMQYLISEIYPSVLEQAKIKPVDYPNVEVKKLDKSGPILFDIKVDVYPEAKLGNYKGIAIKKLDTTVSASEVDSTLDFIKKGYAKQKEMKEEDVLLDDEFAKSVSTAPTMDELKGMLRSNIEIEKKNEAETARRAEVSKKLAEVVEAEIPSGMIEREIDLMVDDLTVSLKRSKMTLESYLSAIKKDMKKMREEIKPNAEIRIKSKLALDKVIEKEKLLVSEEDLEGEIKALAEASGKGYEDYRSELSPELMDSVREYMLREQAVQLVISKAKEE